MPKLTVIILTKDEELHISRCIESVSSIAARVLVVDSGSTDKTVELAKRAGARVLQNPWVNHATQFNWGLTQVSTDSDWVMRLDADEFVTPKLADQIALNLQSVSDDIDGFYVGRRMCFLGRTIRWGGVFPIKVLRLFRRGRGKCENRWMDEHIILDGKTSILSGEVIDDNLKPLTWWIEKHNAYASREVIDMLNREYSFMEVETIADFRGGQAGFKRWIKEYVYAKLPAGTRAFAYFFYRYFFRLGFLDGRSGAAFHFLQGLWYRYLVDAKYQEVQKYMQAHGVSAKTAIRELLDFKV